MQFPDSSICQRSEKQIESSENVSLWNLPFNDMFCVDFQHLD